MMYITVIYHLRLIDVCNMTKKYIIRIMSEHNEVH